MRTTFLIIIFAASGGCAGSTMRDRSAAPAAPGRDPADHPVRSWFHDNFRLSHLWGKKPPRQKAAPRAIIMPPAGGTTTAWPAESEVALPSGGKE